MLGRNHNQWPASTRLQVATATLVAIIIMVVLDHPAWAIAPPLHGGEFPPEVANELRQNVSRSQLTGIGRRLREIKHEKEQAVLSGKYYRASTVTVSLPVVMGNYLHEEHLFTASDYQTVLFGANPTGSMSDYYDEVSYGQFNLTGTVYGPYPAEMYQDYYVNGDYGFGSDFPTNASGFIYSILDYGGADADIDFSQYDNDGPDGIPNSGDDDGYVDCLIVIFPEGDAATGDADNIWAHMSRLRWGAGNPYTTNDPRSGGGYIQIDAYTIQGGELGTGYWDMIMPIGPFCHEFGHILGLPDFYDTDMSTWGAGVWCLMASGTWGVDLDSTTAHTPIQMSAWCKADLGWVIPTVINGTETVQIPAVETNPTIYKLWDDAYQGGRFFLLENRTKTGFDVDIRGEGVLIWHCNEDVCFDNSVDDFRLVDLEEADGLDHLDHKINFMDDGDPYPGSANNTQFDDASYPSANDVFGAPTGVSAESFAYTAGPGSDVSVSLTQRILEGFTISHIHHTIWVEAWGSGSQIVQYGAVRYTTPSDGKLVAVQACVFRNTPVPFTVRIFDDMVGAAPVGLHSTTSGIFPNNPNVRYEEITLSSTIDLEASQTFLVDCAWGPDSYAVPHTKYERPVSGQSYYSPNGSTYSNWTDKDVLLRARIQYETCDCGKRGDVDCDGQTNPVDVVYIVNYVYKQLDALCVKQDCPYATGDMECDGQVNPVDVVYLTNYVYKTLDALCDGCSQ